MSRVENWWVEEVLLSYPVHCVAANLTALIFPLPTVWCDEVHFLSLSTITASDDIIF